MAVGYEGEKKTDTESIQDTLKDVIVVVEKLAPFCSNFEELVSIVKEALNNGGQARLLLKVMTGK